MWLYRTHKGSVIQKARKGGHTVYICYKRHGSPPEYKLNNSKNSMNNIEIVRENTRDSALHNSSESNNFKFTQQQYQTP